MDRSGRLTAHRVGPRLLRLNREEVLQLGRPVGGAAVCASRVTTVTRGPPRNDPRVLPTLSTRESPVVGQFDFRCVANGVEHQGNGIAQSGAKSGPMVPSRVVMSTSGAPPMGKSVVAVSRDVSPGPEMLNVSQIRHVALGSPGTGL